MRTIYRTCNSTVLGKHIFGAFFGEDICEIQVSDFSFWKRFFIKLNIKSLFLSLTGVKSNNGLSIFCFYQEPSLKIFFQKNSRRVLRAPPRRSRSDRQVQRGPLLGIPGQGRLRQGEKKYFAKNIFNKKNLT